MGGDPFFSCWKLTYQEPALKKISKKIFCPNAEILQKKLILLKTNYDSEAYSKKQSQILDRSLNLFRIKYFK